jgi:hypothetical protein
MALNCARKYGGNNAKYISVDETVNICGVRDIRIYTWDRHLSANGHDWACFSTVHCCSSCWQTRSQVSRTTEDYIQNSCLLTQGIKSEQHSETLGKLKTQLRRIHPRIELPLLQHENAWPLTTARPTAEIWRLCFYRLGSPRPHIAPTWRPSNYNTFSLVFDEEVKTVVKLWFRHQDANFYRGGPKTT